MFTLTRPERYAQEIRKSRFLGLAAPIESEADAKRFLAEHSDASASHNCWAWRLGSVYRFSDDGEPGGTAGKPILQAIDGQELDRVVVLVTRWFGGVLLGAGGLIRAYGGTAAQCLRAAEKVPLVATVEISITCDFADLALVQSRLSNRPGAQIDNQHFTDTGAVLAVAVAEDDAELLAALIRDLTHGRAVVARPD
ncbi:YigZ family protein [Aureimonas sp. ME7]|uniref:IMPACT family protein n=1 Tax=Aureimonas sp. ME7 TaxID=2744252 RepID=UPI0015F4326F|nr:YigZ family protein [Aureimonas sp. ME7]